MKFPDVSDPVLIRLTNSPEILAAIVAHVSPHNPQVVNLCVFGPTGIPTPLQGVPYDMTGQMPGHWFFPDDVPREERIAMAQQQRVVDRTRREMPGSSIQWTNPPKEEIAVHPLDVQ